MSTFARLKARTVEEIGGYNVTTDATLLGELANEAVRDLLLQTGVKVVLRTVALTADEDDYTLDDEVLLIKSAWIDGSRPLEPVSPSDIDWLRSADSPSSDTVTRYALAGNDLFMVYPAPSSAATVNLRVVLKPTEMSSDAHDPKDATYGGIPTEFHPALLAYMYWKAASADDDQSSGQGERYRIAYEGQDGRGGELAKVRKYVNGKANVRLPRATVGRRRSVPHDPSADWRW